MNVLNIVLFNDYDPKKIQFNMPAFQYMQSYRNR